MKLDTSVKAMKRNMKYSLQKDSVAAVKVTAQSNFDTKLLKTQYIYLQHKPALLFLV